MSVHLLDRLFGVVRGLELEDAASPRLVVLVLEEVHVADGSDLLLEQVLHVLGTSKREWEHVNGFFECLDGISLRYSEIMESLKLGSVWVFVQLILGPRWPMNQLNKNPNIA